MPHDDAINDLLDQFAESVRSRFAAPVRGEPEEQLRAPFETLVSGLANVLGHRVVIVGETQLEGRLGRPDYAVVTAGLLSGYVELKEPGKGVRPDRFRGHDREQAKRFESLPNIIYSDGNDFALYRNGQLIGEPARVGADPVWWTGCVA